jgi:hypothetical protein
MKIRMLKDYQGELLQNVHYFSQGEIHDVSLEVAEALVAMGRAELVEENAVRNPAPTPSTPKQKPARP